MELALFCKFFLKLGKLHQQTVYFLTGSRLAGKTVWVCEKDDCQKCGDFPDVAEGQWYNIPCGADDGIRGSSVKVVQTTDESLQIAKMEIYGVPQMSTDSSKCCIL